MTWIYEQPLTILLVGIATAAVLAVILHQVSTGAAFLGALAAVVLTLCLLAVEHFIVTDFEQVENTLYGVAAALETNEPTEVMSHLSPNAPALQAEAQMAMRAMKVAKAKVGSDLKVVFQDRLSPPQAKATFIGRIDFKSGVAGETVFAGRFTVTLAKEGERWLVTGYER